MEQSPFSCNKWLAVLGIIAVHVAIYGFYWLIRKLAPGFPQKAFIGFYLVLMPLGFLAIWTWNHPTICSTYACRRRLLFGAVLHHVYRAALRLEVVD